MKLQKFTKNKRQKRIVIGSIVGILLLIGGITLYRTFALYKVEQSFDVLNGTVPDFSSGDIILAFTVNGTKESGIPFPNKNQGFTKKSVTCEKGVQADWDDNTWALKVVNSGDQSKIKCTIDFNAPTFSTYLKSKVTSVADGESGFIKQTHETTEQTSTNATTDYRYIGANPNNYVCLEESGECNDENLYRIIGVIPTQKADNGEYEERVKLIKNKSIGTYYWSGSQDNQSNDWANSTLNKDVLNTEYLTKIQSYQKYIDYAKWYLGGVYDPQTDETYVVEKFYNLERSTTVYQNSSKMLVSIIGLMYPSDYGFATSGTTTINRNSCLNSVLLKWNTTNCYTTNWLYSSKEQWTITSHPGYHVSVWAIYGNGRAYPPFGYDFLFETLPSFYLKSTVLYKSGNGTHDNPYRISIN